MFTLTHFLFVARLFDQNFLSEKVSQSTNSLWEAILTWWFLSYGVVRPVFRVRARFPLNSDDWRLRRQTLVEHWFQIIGFKWLGCYASVDGLSDGFVDALIIGRWTGMFDVLFDGSFDGSVNGTVDGSVVVSF